MRQREAIGLSLWYFLLVGNRESLFRVLFFSIVLYNLFVQCLPWQQWTKAFVWFNYIDISAFHSCVVFYLWQSLNECHLLLSACV
jgi:hypothetical protein